MNHGMAIDMANEIKVRVQNPGEWLIAVRRISERLDLRVERFLPLSGGTTLLVACYAVVEEAGKQRRTDDAVRAAVRDWASYHPAPVDNFDRRNTA